MSLGLMAHTQNITVIVFITIFRHILLRLQQAYENSRHSVGGSNCGKVSLGNLLQSPKWDSLCEDEVPGEGPRQERKKPDQLRPGPASTGFVLHWGPVGSGGTRIKHPGII